MKRPMFGWGSYIPRPEDLPPDELVAERMEMLERQVKNRKIAERYFDSRNGHLAAKMAPAEIPDK